VELCVLDGLAFLVVEGVLVAALVDEDVCVVVDELLELSPPPPPPLPKTHDPCMTPALSDAKKSNRAFDMSSAPCGHDGHCDQKN
jgi:hypothetical protein